MTPTQNGLLVQRANLPQEKKEPPDMISSDFVQKVKDLRKKMNMRAKKEKKRANSAWSMENFTSKQKTKKSEEIPTKISEDVFIRPYVPLQSDRFQQIMKRVDHKRKLEAKNPTDKDTVFTATFAKDSKSQKESPFTYKPCSMDFKESKNTADFQQKLIEWMQSHPRVKIREPKSQKSVKKKTLLQTIMSKQQKPSLKAMDLESLDVEKKENQWILDFLKSMDPEFWKSSKSFCKTHLMIRFEPISLNISAKSGSQGPMMLPKKIQKSLEHGYSCHLYLLGEGISLPVHLKHEREVQKDHFVEMKPHSILHLHSGLVENYQIHCNVDSSIFVDEKQQTMMKLLARNSQMASSFQMNSLRYRIQLFLYSSASPEKEEVSNEEKPLKKMKKEKKMTGLEKLKQQLNLK